MNNNIEICPNCGGEMVYSQIKKRNVCKYCGFGENEKEFEKTKNRMIEEDIRVRIEKEKTARFESFMIIIMVIAMFAFLVIMFCFSKNFYG